MRKIALLGVYSGTLALAVDQKTYPLPGSPIWASPSSDFVWLRSPEFTLRAAPISAVLEFAALGSPGTRGTLQAKLLGAACVHVNGVLATCGPGHNTPTETQIVRAVDVRAFLRGAPMLNVIGLECYYATHGAPPPRVQATLRVTDAGGEYVVASTGATWTGAPADGYFNPTGDAGVSWYAFPNEFLDRAAFPLGWASPFFTGAWAPAAAAPAFAYPLYLEPASPPLTLVRHACAVTSPMPGRQILDFGQEFIGGVNLSFTGGAPAGAQVHVILAEELMEGGASVRSPMRTGNNWNSSWTLSGDAAHDSGIVHHEPIQFRYAQIDQFTGAHDTVFAPGAAGGAGAWVIQHPAGGDGANPFEDACSTSVPAAQLWGNAPLPRTPLATFSSDSPSLDKVWDFCAYTIIATSLDVNVDGQTRERDVDIVDALNTARGQYSVFSPGDVSVAERTARETFTNDTGMWSQWYDFKASAVMTAHDHALFTGDVALVADLWSNDDASITVPSGSYNCLQFEAGLRYANATGRGVLSFPKNGACGGSWSCEPLIDWPTTTRDGYDCSIANYEDTGRSSLGALAITALSDVAGWLGHADAAARYRTLADGVVAGMRALNLRHNGSEAYFVDGAAGPSTKHAAVHSTLFAISAGAADGDAALGAALTAFLARHGVAPSSCMMGRWWVEGLYRIGVWAPEAADLALAVLTAPEYPSWLDMLAQGATTTMEAWRPADKSNLDWAHPWCASPSFTIPAGTLGVMPTAPGWTSWRVAPQPASLSHLTATVPTPTGMLSFAFTVPSPAHAMLSLTVLDGQNATVCLPAPGSAMALAARAPSVDALIVDGVPVAATTWGRMLCTPSPLGVGAHIVTRQPAAASEK